MSDYSIELSSEAINGSMNYKRKFNMSGDIGGGSGGAYVVSLTEDNDGYYVCDKTAADIFEASFSKPVIFEISEDGYGLSYVVATCSHTLEGYTFLCLYDDVGSIASNIFTAATGTDYPSDKPETPNT